MMALRRPFWLCVCLVFWVSAAAMNVRAQNGFAVQVGVVQKAAEAEAQVTSLRVRGIHSYWVKAEVAGQGVIYRVRIGGQFANAQQATEFGRKLVQAKLIREYSIFRYEAPGGTLGESGHALAEKAVARKRQGDDPSRKPTLSSGDNSNTSVTINPPPTDYLVTGSPLSVPEPLLVPSPQPNTPRTTAKQKHQDEIELDDFKEFAPPMLQGSIETKDGHLLVTLQNRNSRHAFRGKVKWVLSDGEQERPQLPMQIEIGPGQTQEFPLQGSGKSYLLTVQDEQGAPLLTQNGAWREGGQQQVSTGNQLARNIAPNPASPPGDVPIQQDEDLDDGIPRKPRPGEKVLLETANYPKDDSERAAESKPEAKKEPLQPGDVKVIVRQVAESAENVTVEFEILAREPLGMIAMTIHTASTSDTKQAIMTTKQGRLPFLAPAGDTNGTISYELRNEQGVLLATGSKAFRDLAKQ